MNFFFSQSCWNWGRSVDKIKIINLFLKDSNTSLTTFFVLLIMFLFGGEVIRGFMFALMIGVVVGTYSSLFIATPIMVDTLKNDSDE